MFSVIIPLYNKEKYISKAVNSVLSQSFTDFELIIVDDGSTDNSLKLIRLFKDVRIKIITQSNQGVSTARNNGVKTAERDYISFLDADDWWDKQFLEKMNALIIEYPKAGVYGSKYYKVKNSKIKESINHEPCNFKGYINYFKAYSYAWWMPLTSISVIIPKKIFLKENGFKKELKFGEDFDLWIRLSLKYKIAYLNEPLAYYNQDVDSNQRALGALGHKKKWNPSEHYIFNLGYLEEEENKNSDLKNLLDGLRVHSLIRFRINGWFKKELNEILKQINFSSQPAYFRRIYNWPTSIIKLYFKLKAMGYYIKQLVKKSL